MNNLKTFQTYTLTSDQDAILVSMLSYFSEMGLPEDWDSEAFDSLFQEVFDPKQRSFFSPYSFYYLLIMSTLQNEIILENLWEEVITELRDCGDYSMYTNQEIESLVYQRFEDMS